MQKLLIECYPPDEAVSNYLLHHNLMVSFIKRLHNQKIIIEGIPSHVYVLETNDK
jgi:hypothetical protein